MWSEVLSQQEHWNFILSQPSRSGVFLQTPAWVDYQKFLGNDVKVLSYNSASKITGICVLVRSVLPAGFYYWFIPKGPVFRTSLSANEQSKALADLFDYFKKDRGIFLRLEPLFRPEAVKKIKDVNPRATTIIDLVPDFSVILSNMHEKTRYNMRLAERKGLKFRWGEEADLKNFWQLLQTTAQRERFSTHKFNHYQGMFGLFGKEPLNTNKVASRLALVEYKNQLLAASLVLIVNKQATYLHGASSREHRELMAPYLLHGETMRLLKEAGCVNYDMWGVQPKDGSISKWSGFSRFKLGWGGKYFEDPGTFDFIINQLPYLVYKMARSLLT